MSWGTVATLTPQPRLLGAYLRLRGAPTPTLIRVAAPDADGATRFAITGPGLASARP
ncbi:MAG: hypothetical protein K0U78_20060 [Actinomycetia bacterium]|nr:hypothetical protein [Actinomycetes bacterium]